MIPLPDRPPGRSRRSPLRGSRPDRPTRASPTIDHHDHTHFIGQTPHPGSTLFADGGFWGREYLASMQLIDVQLITPAKHKVSKRPASEIAKARIRLVIESVFATLKRQMGLQDHQAKTLPGLIARIAQRLLALTLGIYLNILLDRPPRALAAYDGR